MHIVFERAEPLAPDIMSFWFRPERPLSFVPGQFADLHVPHADVDARGDTRQFSFTSPPSEELLSIAVRFPPACSSYKRALRALAPGTVLHLAEPLGDFVLPKGPGVPLVWVAGGIGSAAFVALAKAMIYNKETRPVTLLQSARRSEDLLFTNIWKSAGITYTQTVTGQDGSWNSRRERFSANDILAAAKRPEDTLFYISGSEQMVEEICVALGAYGIRPEQLVREAFTGY